MSFFKAFGAVLGGVLGFFTALYLLLVAAAYFAGHQP